MLNGTYELPLRAAGTVPVVRNVSARGGPIGPIAVVLEPQPAGHGVSSELPALPVLVASVALGVGIDLSGCRVPRLRRDRPPRSSDGRRGQTN